MALVSIKSMTFANYPYYKIMEFSYQISSNGKSGLRR